MEKVRLREALTHSKSLSGKVDSRAGPLTATVTLFHLVMRRHNIGRQVSVCSYLSPRPGDEVLGSRDLAIVILVSTAPSPMTGTLQGFVE